MELIGGFAHPRRNCNVSEWCVIKIFSKRPIINAFVSAMSHSTFVLSFLSSVSCSSSRSALTKILTKEYEKRRIHID